MAHVVHMGTGVQHRFILELRFDGGELYWDRCGRIARQLMRREGWAFQSMDGNGYHLVDEDRNLAFTYSHARLDLTQSQTAEVPTLLPAGEFAAIAEEFSEVVAASLELEVFLRIGFRLWTLYPTEDIEDASSRIGKMSLFSPSKSLSELGEVADISVRAVVTRPRHSVRIAATPFEQQVRIAPSVIAKAKTTAHRHSTRQDKVLLAKLKAAKAIKTYPAVGVMVDMDAYVEDPPYPDELSIRTFIDGAIQDFAEIRDAILTEENRK